MNDFIRSYLKIGPKDIIEMASKFYEDLAAYPISSR